MAADEEKKKYCCCGAAAVSMVTARCFVPGCKYTSVITWGANEKIVDEREAAKVMKGRLRKHVNTWFDWEKTSGHIHNALSDEEVQEWSTLLRRKDVKSFEVWDKTTLARRCRHHPRNVPARGTWHYQLHRLKADDPLQQQMEACITMNERPIHYNPFLLHHWPPALRQMRTRDVQAASRKRRKKPHYLLANAAVRGYKRYCKARPPPQAPPGSALDLAPGRMQWIRQATFSIKAYIHVATIEWEASARSRGSEHKAWTADPGCASELQTILDQAHFKQAGVNVTLTDINYKL